MTDLVNRLATFLGLAPEAAERLILMLLMVGGIVALRALAVRALARRIQAPQEQYGWTKGIT